MKALVHVALKRTVLDPQGKTIQAALAKQGFQGMDDLRQGKLFEIQFRAGIEPALARQEAERAAREVLTNPVIEEFSISWQD